MTRLTRYADPPQLREEVDPCLSAETAVTGTADAAERHLRFVLNRRSVDVADARADAPRNPKATRGIAREHGGREAIIAVVRHADRLFPVSDPDDADHRSEAFVVIKAHVACDLVDHGRCA